MSLKKCNRILSLIAVIIAIMAGISWYHNQLFHNEPFLTAEGESSPTSTPDQAGLALKGKITDLPIIIGKLDLTEEQNGQVKKLIEEILTSIQEKNQVLNELSGSVITESVAEADLSDKIRIIQQEFEIRIEQFKLDLSDVVGDEVSDKVAVSLTELIPPVLLEERGIPPASHGAHGD